MNGEGMNTADINKQYYNKEKGWKRHFYYRLLMVLQSTQFPE